MVNKLERGQATVFISYAREDKDFALTLVKHLGDRGIEAKGDWLLTTGEDYAKRLREFSLVTHAFIFIITPDSIKSTPCLNELALAVENKKQILPVCRRDHQDDTLLDSALRAPQWTFLREGDDVDLGMGELVKAINTDFALMDMHGRLLVAADNWHNNGRNRSYLLRRDGLKNAEGWLAMTSGQPDKLPQPIPLQTEFILASQRARSRGTRIGVGISAGVILSLTILSIVAWAQRTSAVTNAGEARKQTAEAERQRNQAEENAAEAKRQQSEAERQRKVAEDNATEAKRQKKVAEDNATEAERQRNQAEENAAEARRQQGIAEDRQVAAQTAQLDATSSQMFAESRRVEAQRELERERLAQLNEDLEITELENYQTGDKLGLRLKNLKSEISQTEQELKTLDARGREYRQKGVAMLHQADQKWSGLRAGSSWVEPRQRPTVPTLFSLEVLDATNGECMILHYGDLDRPNFVLIGGGMRPIFKKILEPRLAELKGTWGQAGALHLDTVIASHLDAETSEGLIALTENILSDRQAGRSPKYTIGTLWYNSFEPLPKRWPKAHLPLNAQTLGIQQNAPFDHFVMRPDSGAVRIAKTPLEITVINPDSRRIKDLAAHWIDRARDFDKRAEEESKDNPTPAEIPQEKFSSRDLIRLQAPNGPLSGSVFEGYREKQVGVTNLASIAVVFELFGKRILYAGDAVGSDILKGLHAAGYLSAAGTAHVDLMIVPHSGSDYNVTKDFFRRVTADHYVLLGDGQHKNPEVATLKMIEEARADAEITLYFANRDGRDDHGTRLDQYFLENVPWAKSHRRVFRRFNEQHILINLLDSVRY